MDLRLKDKVVLITGSSRGIGLATARAFAAEGCRLMLSARSGDALRVAEIALRADGATVASEVADVTQPGTWRATLAGHAVTHIVHGATELPAQLMPILLVQAPQVAFPRAMQVYERRHILLLMPDRDAL